MCIELVNLFVGQVFDHMFDISFEKDFICSYMFPICDESLTKNQYLEMKEDEYVREIL